MIQQEILDYNKRCAEFLGWDESEFSRTNSPEYIVPNILRDNIIVRSCTPENLKFHCDWNWIMEVVEAIVEKVGFKTVDECSEEEWYATLGVTRLAITSKKEAVVKAINQFLTWYNKQK